MRDLWEARAELRPDGEGRVWTLAAQTPEGAWAAGDTPRPTAWTQRRERGRPVRRTSLSSCGQLATEQVGTESPPEKADPKFGAHDRK